MHTRVWFSLDRRLGNCNLLRNVSILVLVSNTSTHIMPPPAKEEQFLLLYGSQTGQAHAIAEDLHHDSQLEGLKGKLVCLDQLKEVGGWLLRENFWPTLLLFKFFFLSIYLSLIPWAYLSSPFFITSPTPPLSPPPPSFRCIGQSCERKRGYYCVLHNRRWRSPRQRRQICSWLEKEITGQWFSQKSQIHRTWYHFSVRVKRIWKNWGRR